MRRFMLKSFRAVAVKLGVFIISLSLIAYIPLVFILATSDEAFASGSPSIKPSYQPNELLVGFIKNVPQKKAKNIIKKNKHSVAGQISELNVYIVKVKGNVKKEAKKYLTKNLKKKGVRFAEPNYKFEAFAVPNDALYEQQWALKKTFAPAGWDIERGESKSVTIAVVDTGVDKNHPDVDGKLVPGYDLINNDDDPTDDHGHGTHVAAIAAAETNNSEGVAGVSWGAKIMPVKVLDSDGAGFASTVANGIIWATLNGAKIINLSLGGSDSQTVKDAVDLAYNKGRLIVAAAGNSGKDDYLYPASYENVISVAATDSDDNRASFSTYNDRVDLAAPGVSILSAVLKGKYQSWSGTSMATPHVAGLAALIFSKNPELNQIQVEQIMKNTADDVNFDTYPGYDIYIGEGRINIAKALGNENPGEPEPPQFPSVKINSPANGEVVSGVVTIDATIDDSSAGDENITEAEYRTDGGQAVSMTAKDGVFDSSVEDVIAEFDADALSNGGHTVSVRGMDAAGNWSYWTAVNIVVKNYGLYVEITYPDPASPQTSFSGVTEIRGTAKHKDPGKFSRYVIDYQKNHSSENSAANNKEWTTVLSSDQMVDNDLLGQWDTTGLTGMFKLRLTAYDVGGNSESVIKYLRIDKKK